MMHLNETTGLLKELHLTLSERIEIQSLNVSHLDLIADYTIDYINRFKAELNGRILKNLW